MTTHNLANLGQNIVNTRHSEDLTSKTGRSQTDGGKSFHMKPQSSVLFKTRIWEVSPKHQDLSIRQKAHNMRSYNADSSEFIQKLIDESTSKEVKPTYAKSEKSQDHRRNSSMSKLQESNPVLIEARKILENRNRDRSVSISIKLKSTYDKISESKDINLKNYIIDILKEGRTRVNEKEINIKGSLKDSGLVLDEHMHQFLEFMEKDKLQTKINDAKLLDIITKNKQLKEIRQNLANDHFQVVEFLDSIVLRINNSRDYAKFFFKVMDSDVKGRSAILIEDETRTAGGNSKEDKLKLAAEMLIREFSEKIDEEKFKNLSEDTSILISKFQVIEDNIIKYMDKKFILEVESTKQENAFLEELQELENRENLVRQEKLKHERDLINIKKSVQQLEKREREQGNNDELFSLIQEINLIGNFEKVLGINSSSKNKINSLIPDLLDDLKQIEITINKSINDMELMEKENLVLFNQQVKNKKDKNKDEKQHELLLRQRLLDEENKKKSEDRMNKIIIKGRRVSSMSMLKKVEKKKEYKRKNNEEDNNNEMLDIEGANI